MQTESGLYHFRFYLSDGFDAYLLREHETTYEYISPITYAWMQAIGLHNWEEVIETQRVNKDVIFLEACGRIHQYEEWMFQYPVDYTTLRHFNDIALFFDTFDRHRKKTIVPRLEQTILKMEKRIALVHLESLVTFVYNQHTKHPDRLRLFYSPLITKYVMRGSE